MPLVSLEQFAKDMEQTSVDELSNREARVRTFGGLITRDNPLALAPARRAAEPEAIRL